MTTPLFVSSPARPDAGAGPLRIVAHNAGLRFGGGEKALLSILRGLADRGHAITLYCGYEAVRERFASAGIATGLIRVGGDVMLPDIVRFARRVRRHDPDVVLLTTFRKFLITGAGARLAGARRVIGRIGNETDVPDSLKYRVAFTRLLDAIVVNAESMRTGMFEIWPALDRSRIVTIAGGVRPTGTLVAPEAAVELKRKLGIAPGAPVIGSAGRLAKQKRFDRLLRALARLPGVHCVIAGSGIEEEPLRALACELGLADRVHLPGYLEDLTPFFAALDVYVVSSDREGMSNAMLEAMNAGLPVASTPVSGAREALDADEALGPAGVVTSGFDPDELSTAIARMLADAALRHGLGRAGRQRIPQRYTFGRMIDEWEHVLRGTAGTPHGPATRSDHAGVLND
jgi:glycosyltransferase involved in cell wall biosynthesis